MIFKIENTLYSLMEIFFYYNKYRENKKNKKKNHNLLN